MNRKVLHGNAEYKWLATDIFSPTLYVLIQYDTSIMVMRDYVGGKHDPGI